MSVEDVAGRESGDRKRLTLWMAPDVIDELKEQAKQAGVSASAYVSVIVREREIGKRIQWLLEQLDESGVLAKVEQYAEQNAIDEMKKVASKRCMQADDSLKVVDE